MNASTASTYNPDFQPLAKDHDGWATPPCPVVLSPFDYRKIELSMTGIEAIVDLLIRNSIKDESTIEAQSGFVLFDDVTEHGLRCATAALVRSVHDDLVNLREEAESAHLKRA